MRYFQNTLVVIGITSLGAISCGPGLLYVLAVTIWQPRGLSYAMVIPAFSCGSALGAFLCFAVALHWITTRKGEAWKPRVWFGVALGITVGLAICFVNVIPGYPELGEFLQYWPVTAVFAAALGTLGGIVASFVGTLAAAVIRTGGRDGQSP